MVINNGSNGAMGLPTPGLATAALHADQPDPTLDPNHSVAPSISLSTTFRAPHPDSANAKLLREAGEDTLDMQDPPIHIYSRYSQDTVIRLEKVLSKVMSANALTYSSGLTAAHAAMLHYAPTVIAIRKGYHGVHMSMKLYARGRQLKVIDLDDEYPKLPSGHGGLLVWVETPLNPTGEARDLKKYVQKAHAVGAKVIVDATFAPPPLQNPFVQGVDMVMHSGTKYFGGHSDLLCGVLAVQEKKEWNSLWHDRTYLGANLGSMEAYLLLRSLRTLTVRVTKQSATATQLASWLHGLSGPNSPEHLKNIVARTYHSSLQPRTDKEEGVADDLTFDPSTQMPGGHTPTFAFKTTKPEYAAYIPHLTTYFTPATSLGGVESLLEHRIMSDPSEDPTLLRVSVGLEDFEDLKADLETAFQKVLVMEKKGDLKQK